jgi:hypothetical protein
VSDEQELNPIEQQTETAEQLNQSGLEEAEATSERALVPVQVSQVDFYGDGLTVVLVEIDGERQVLVPLRQFCQYLGVGWASQYQRTKRDEILVREMAAVVITTTAGPGQRVFAAAASGDLLAAGSPAWLAVYPQSESRQAGVSRASPALSWVVLSSAVAGFSARGIVPR